MTPPDRPGVRVTDLRGKGSPPPPPVLADPSGRRAVLLHRLGRFVGALFLLWFVCLVLAGLGLLPASGVPLAGELGPRTQPPSLGVIPAPKPTSVADLRPATPANKTAVDATDSGTVDPTEPDKTETTTKTTPARTPTVPVATAPGNSGSAPGQTSTTAPGNSGSAPGQTSTTAPGNSGSAPGQTTTTHGNSDTAPGQTHTDTNPHGPGR